MRITPVLFRTFSTQNLKNQQRNQFSNISFQAKIDRTNSDYKKLIDEGYKLYNSNVSLISNGQNISGAAFVQKTKWNDIVVIITDDKFKRVGRADATFRDDSAEVCINNFYRTTIRHVGTAGYDNLFSYIRKNFPKIKKAKANIITDESFKFHSAYGFKVGDEEVEFNINDFMDTYMEYPLR